MNLSNLKPAAGSTKSDKRILPMVRVPAGAALRRAVTKERSAFGPLFKLGFEGGQILFRDVCPKFGFTNLKRVEYKGINLLVLEELAQKSSLKSISVDTLIEAGLVNKNARVKILGNGTLSVALEVTAYAFSKSARLAIKNQGVRA